MKDNTSPMQLPLSVQIRDDASFDNYFAGGNRELVDTLIQSCQGKASDGAIFMSGPSGVGKSHLLQAACHAGEQNDVTAVYIPLKELAAESPEMLDGLEDVAIICLDDIQLIAGDTDWEQAIFHLFNRVFDSGAQLIFAADKTVANLGIRLADLTSRLAWGFVYRVHALSDEEKLQALQERARRRGFDLPESVGQYLLRHCPRDMRVLHDLLQELDVASLAAQRKLTVPFVKSWLQQRDSAQSQLF